LYPHTNNSRLSAFALILPLALLASLPRETRAETPFQASQKFIESGQSTEARRSLESELRMRPDNIQARYNLAILVEQIGHQSDAISLYKENLAIAWHLPSLVNLASLLQASGKTSEAVQWLEKGTEKLRREATPWYLLAAISEKQNNRIRAAKQYRRALKADPLNGFAHLHYASFQSRNKLADHGVKHGERATKLLPTCAPCWRKYGDILQAAGRAQEALAAYQRSLAVDPDNKTRLKLVSTLRLLGYNTRADQIQRGLDLNTGK